MAGGITSASTGITGGAGGGITGSGGGLTQQQSLALAFAAAQKKHSSFLTDVLHSSGSALGTTLGYLMRPAAAIASASYETDKAGNKFDIKSFKAGAKGFLAGLEGKEHKTFSDVIRLQYPKFAAHHKVATAIAGLSLDVLTDPTLPLVLGSNLIPGVGEAADASLAARLASDLGKGKDAYDNLKRANEATAALKELGPEFDARKALAKAEAERAFAEIHGKALSTHDQLILNIAQRSAKQEAEDAGRRVLQARYSIPFSGGKSIPLTPATLAGRRVAPLAPKLARTAAGEGVVGKIIPGAAATAGLLGRVGKYGFGEEKYAQAALAAAHSSDDLRNQYVARSRAIITAPAEKAGLTRDSVIKAIDWGETHTGIVSGRYRRLDANMLQAAVDHGELTKDEGALVTNWHEHMNFIDAQNKASGLKYEEELGNKLYVPHQFLRDGGVVTLKALKGTFGPGIKRSNQLTLKQIVDSNIANMETDPWKILFHYNSLVAKHQTQQALLEWARGAAGVVSHIPDEAKDARIMAHVGNLEAKMEESLKGIRYRKISIGRQVQEWAKAQAHSAFKSAGKRLAEHDTAAAVHAEQALTVGAVKNVPSFSNARKAGAQWLKDSVNHLPEEDRKRLVELHSLLARHRNIAARLAKLEGKRGGPATKERALAEETSRLLNNINKTPSVTKAEDFNPVGVRGASWKKNIGVKLESAETSLREAWKEVKDKYPTVQNINHEAKAKAHLAAYEREANRLGARLETIKDQAKLRRNKLDAEYDDDLEKVAAKYEKLKGKRDYQLSRVGTGRVPNPAIPEGYQELPNKIGGASYYFPPEIHKAMTRIEAIYTSDTTMQEFETAARKLLSWWKLSVTSINPGYRVRNTLSDMWNMYIAGVPIPRMAQYGTYAAQLQRHIRSAGEKLSNGGTWRDLTKTERNALNLHSEMTNHGILSGLFQGDVQRGANILQHGNTWGDLLVRTRGPLTAGKLYLQAAQDINRNVENWGRITHYLYRRQYQHLNAADAADWVKKAHFDYTELTPIEQNKFKTYIPFYTWSRKDIPYQLAQLVSRPGKYVTYAKVARTANELADGGDPYGADDQPNTLPSFYRHNFGFRVPGFGQDAYYVPNTGVQDLTKVTHPRTAISLLSPALTIPYEVATGTSTFTGQPIQGTHPRNPISGWSASLLSHVPGANVGLTSRNVRGEKVIGEGANPWVGFLASQTPLTNYLVNQSSSIKRTQRGGSSLANFNYLAGTSVYNRDKETEATAASLAFDAKYKKFLRGLRDIGIVPESAKGGNSAYQQKLQAILNG